MDDSERPAVFLGCKYQLSERHLTPIEQLVHSIWWVLYKLAYYTLFSATMIVVPDPTLLATFKTVDIHRSLQGYLVDLSMYRLAWC